MKLSIVIPVFNVEKYIRRTLDSIFSQKPNPEECEVIVVNDGTTDNSMDIVAEFTMKFSNIVVVNQNNHGLSSARNSGIQKAKGDYIWFVDSDDWIHVEAIKNVLDSIAKNQPDVFLFGIKEYSESSNNNLIKTRKMNIRGDSQEMDLLECLNSKIEITPIQIYVINREFIFRKNLFFIEGLLHEDMEYAPRMLLQAKSIVVNQLYIYCYLRRCSGSITSSAAKVNERIKSLMTISKEQEKLKKIINGDRNRKAFCLIQMWLLINTFNQIKKIGYNLDKDELGVKSFFSSKKKIVFKNLFYRYNKINVLVCRCVFLLNPRILLKIGKGI